MRVRRGCLFSFPALRILLAATSCMALVICLVDFTERIRVFQARVLGIFRLRHVLSPRQVLPRSQVVISTGLSPASLHDSLHILKFTLAFASAPAGRKSNQQVRQSFHQNLSPQHLQSF